MEQQVLIINQIFEIKQKLIQENLLSHFERNFNKLDYLFEEEGWKMIDPIGEPYSESRTDCEASIVGYSRKMRITKVIKPAIYKSDSGKNELIQKAIVIVE